MTDLPMTPEEFLLRKPAAKPEQAPATDQLTPEEFLGPKPGSDPTVPVPKALVDRVGGTVLDDIYNVAKAAWKGAREGFGSEPLGMSDRTAQELRDMGIFAKEGTGGPIRFLNEALMRPAATAIDFVARATQAGAYGIGRGFAKAMAKPDTSASAERSLGDESINFMNFLLMTELGGQPMTRIEVGPTGVPRETIVGRIPRESDFLGAAKVVGQEATSLPVLRRMYEERGITPQEVAHDMASDPTIRQDIVAGRIPDNYGGEPPKEPPPPAGGEPPKEPPPPGGGGALVPREEPPVPAVPEEPLPVGSLEEAQKKILDRISVGEERGQHPMTFDRLYTRLMDDLNPFKTATKEAVEAQGMDYGKLPTANDPYELGRLTRGTFGKADRFIRYDQISFDTYRVIGRGYEQIMKDVGPDLDPFRAYIASQRVIELEKRGITSGFDLEAAKRVAGDPAMRAKYDKLAGEYRGYNNALAAYLRDSGVISHQAYKAMKEANKLHVPFYRWLGSDEIGGGGPGGPGAGMQSRNPIKAIKGADLAIIDPLETTLRNTYVYIALAEKNAVGLELVDLLKRANKGAIYEVDMLPPREPPARPAGPGLPAAPESGPPAPVPELPRLPAPEGGVEAQWRAAEGEVLPPAKAEMVQLPDKAGSQIVDAEFESVMKEAGIDPEHFRALVETTKVPASAGEIHVFRKGVRETYKVADPDLVVAFKGLDRQTATLIQQVLAVPAKLLRAGATLTPEFAVGNATRDFFTAFVQTKGAIFSPIDTVRGAKSILTADMDYRNALSGGFANAAMTSLDRQYIQERILHLNGETGIMERAWNVVTDPTITPIEKALEVAAIPLRTADRYVITPLRLLQELIENSTRMGVYKRVAGVAKNPEIGKAGIQAGAYAAREATVDFMRVGSQMRAYNAITAFANMNLQGPDRLARAFRENPGSTAVKVMAGITLPSVLLWAHNHTDPRYQDLPTWQKDMYWIFITDNWREPRAGDPEYPDYLTRTRDGKTEINAGTILRVKKPFELGILFGSAVERTLDAYVDKSPRPYQDLATNAVAAMLPSFFPTFMAPIVEQMANRNQLTGAPLVTAQQEKELPAYRYGNYTTETSKALGRMFGAVPGFDEAALDPHSVFHGMATAITSPAILENYVNSWTGGMGRYAMQVADYGLRKSGAAPDIKPIASLEELPFIRAFLVMYPAGSARPVSDFYDRNARSEMILNSLSDRAKVGDVDAVQAIISTYGTAVVMKQTQKTLGEMSALVHMVYENPEIPRGEKRQLIDNIYYEMIQIARQGNAQLDQVDEALKGFKVEEKQ